MKKVLYTFSDLKFILSSLQGLIIKIRTLRRLIPNITDLIFFIFKPDTHS